MKHLISKYYNGPVSIQIFDDGTKVREWDEKIYGITPTLEFAESCDVKITNRCNRNCEFCHENSTSNGEHGNLKAFIDILKKSNLPRGVEFAIGGGNPLEHPDLEEFLYFCKGKGFIVNMTMNLFHLTHIDNQIYTSISRKKYNSVEYIKYLLKSNLIKGLGVSVNKIKDFIDSKIWKWSNNIVIHLIEGICENPLHILSEYYNQYNIDSSFKPKILILGWKDFGRLHQNKDVKSIAEAGSKFWQKWILLFINKMNDIGGVVAFDNLAIKHLDLLNRLPKDITNKYYMGEDGTHTFYIDLVNWKFGKQSTTPIDQRYDISDKSMREMYNIIFKSVK